MKYDNLFARLNYCTRCAGRWLLHANGKCPVCEYCRVCDNLTQLVNGKCPHGHSEEEQKRLVDGKNK